MPLLASTFQGLLFFDRSLALRNDPAASGDTTQPPGVRLASWLITPARTGVLGGAAFGNRARLNRARALLASVAQGMFDGAGAQLAAAEWEWAAGAPFVRQQLEQEAARIDFEGSVEAVRRAIREELLPVLHLRSLLLGGQTVTSRSSHLKALQRWTMTDPSDGLMRAFAIALVANERSDGTDGTDVEPPHDQVAKLLAARPSSDTAREALLRAYSGLLLKQVKQRVDRKLTGWSDPMLQKCRPVADAAGASVPLMNVLSLLHLVRGTEMMQSDPDQSMAAMNHLGLAVLHNPLNMTAREQIQEWMKACNELMGRARSSPGTIATARVRRLADALSAVQTLPERPEGAAVVRARTAALVAELQLRLQVDGRTPPVGQIRELIEALNQVYRDAPKRDWTGSALLEEVRRRVTDRDRSALTLPWQRIGSAMEKLAIPDADVLMATLPEPEAVDFAALKTAVVKSASNAAATAALQTARPATSARVPRTLLFTSWLFSAQNISAKIAAAAAFLIILHGLYLIHHRSAATAELEARDEIYRRLVGSATDDAHQDALIATASEFLGRAKDSDDPRQAAVKELLHTAMLRRDYLRAMGAAQQADQQKRIEFGLQFVSDAHAANAADPRIKQVMNVVAGETLERSIALDRQNKSQDAAALLARYDKVAQVTGTGEGGGQP